MELNRKCDFCGKKAIADGKTKMGPWGYMCESCLQKYGYPDSKGLVTYIGRMEDDEE